MQELRYHISISLPRRYVPPTWEDALVSPENSRLAAIRLPRDHDRAEPRSRSTRSAERTGRGTERSQPGFLIGLPGLLIRLPDPAS